MVLLTLTFSSEKNKMQEDHMTTLKQLSNKREKRKEGGKKGMKGVEGRRREWSEAKWERGQ